MHKAAGRGHKEIVELLIDEGADVNAKDKRGTTPLHEAAGRGHNKDVAELLIAKGADVNAKDDNGWTPLHHAVPDGHKEIAELLIAKGGDVNAKGIYGTPLDHAEAEWEGDFTEVNAARNEVADLLRKHGGKNGTIHSAARGGDFEAVREFLAAGTDVNAKDGYGNTPLDFAVEHDKPETSDLLRKHGGKTVKELKAEESIHDAARFGITEAIKQHLAAGTDVNAKTAKGGTPLDWANAGNQPETADLLRKHGGKTAKELKAEGK
jgi:ankyrin repeat protein